MAAADEQLKEKLTEQRKTVSELNLLPLVNGELWAIVSTRWVNLWNCYVGGDSTSMEKFGNENYNPGRIDNSSIIEAGGNMKDHLLAETDYTFFHKRAWDLLADYYGTVHEQPILRRVIEKGKFHRTPEIEVYLLNIKLAEYTQPDAAILRKFSRTEPVTAVEKAIRSQFNIPADSEARLWMSLSGTNYELLTNKNQRLEDQVSNNQYVLLEVKNSDGKWPRGEENDAKKFSRSPSACSSRLGTSGPAGAPTAPPAPMQTRSSGSLGGSASPGICGLSNLGNTCFMNSALQSLSNVHLLTEYFLSDKWRAELNFDNPLGMHGEIAKRYGELVKDIWSGSNWHVVPRNFKHAVGQFAPQFSGFQQQDSQELMAFLLDGLHEDLNRIVKKPYIEIKDSDGRQDHVVAAESWRDYRRRNDSIIVDLFHGQLKSTLVCPECSKISVTFDPFCYLSLPVPTEQNRPIVFYLVSKDPTRKPLKCKVIVPIKGQIGDLCQEIGAKFKVLADCLLLADVYNNKFHKVFSPDDSYNNISNERDYIYAFELERPVSDADCAVVKVYFSTTAKYSPAFGLPLVFSIPLNLVTYSKLYQTVMEKSVRFISVNSPDPKSTTWWKDHSSTLDDEGICDSGEDEDSSPAPPPLFALHRSTANLSMENSLLDGGFGEEDVLKVSQDLYLIARFQPKAKEFFFNDQNAKNFDQDASVGLRLQTPTHHLEDCLKLFTEEEVLGKKDAWHCPRCKKFQCASKKIDLWSLPKVLVIHLKRFHYDRYFRNKIDKLIEFPIRGLDIRNWLLNPEIQESATYDLVSVSNHYGGLGGGHYAAFGRNYRDGKWYYFDDSSVSPSSESQIVTKAAYVLMYVRSDLMSAPAGEEDSADLMDVS